MAIVLAATGLVIYDSFRSDLLGSENRALRSRVEELAALVQRSGTGALPSLSQVSSAEDDFAQVLSNGGRALAGTPQVGLAPVLARRQLLAAARAGGRGGIFLERPPLPELDGRVRIEAMPVSSPRGPLVVVAGTALGDPEQQLSDLQLLLVLGGLGALLLSCLAGYAVAAAALRPVEEMRRRAASIPPGDLGERLPVPRSGDELERLGATLNQLLDRIQAAFLRERLFIAEASHELRTPLAILRTEVDLALRRGRSPEELRQALVSASAETDRLVSLAEDLLVLARLDDGRMQLRVARLDVCELLDGAAARARERAANQQLPILIHVDAADCLLIRGDPVRIEQALGNLLDNAMRFARSECRLSARAAGDAVELHVSDDGPGFEPGVIAGAFERFVRGSTPVRRDGAGGSGGSGGAGNGSETGTAYGGAGLGLAIVAAIAASHGGRAHAANRDRGADVWLELPAAEPAAPAARPTVAVHPA